MAEIRSTTGAATQRQRRAFLFGFADRIGELLAEDAGDGRRRRSRIGVEHDRARLARAT